MNLLVIASIVIAIAVFVIFVVTAVAEALSGRHMRLDNVRRHAAYRVACDEARRSRMKPPFPPNRVRLE